ncbi:MAG: MarR family winged helix-turn-helix transcriptional regulator [Kiloniellales bacterium]|nr:MarR family winged helix-turn-helix transcriptional regulator [Kiloniellales bacterium]MDJ0971983.1 MarR family winged helix-turn-helix transcriptional regulator [Kiloniellales bacterium]
MERDPEDLREAARAATRCANFNLRRASRALGQVYDAALRPLGLKGTQFSLLTALALLGPVPLSELARELGMDRTSLTRNLRPLLREGYVREDRGEDRRQRLLALTEAGLRIYREALPLWRAVQDRIEARLGTERLERLLSDLAAARKP